jgi:lysophospholipid acyltransferase (LPLAT)-like uncharacterized protein
MGRAGEVAKLSGAPLIPVVTSSKNHWVTRSWDAAQLPRPFTRVAIRFGAPVRVPQDATPEVMETQRLEIERRLRDMTEQNDASIASE